MGAVIQLNPIELFYRPYLLPVVTLSVTSRYPHLGGSLWGNMGG